MNFKEITVKFTFSADDAEAKFCNKTDTRK